MQIRDLVSFSGRPLARVVRQSEASECGLACVAMIAEHYGAVIDLPTLRRFFNVSLRGSSLRSLMEMLEKLGFVSRAMRGEPVDVRMVQLPAILHWNMNHFVVLTAVKQSAKGTRYLISDPARGALSLTEWELSERFTGVFLEIRRGNSFQPEEARSGLKIGQLWSRVEGLPSTLTGVILLSILMQSISLSIPFFLQIGVDTVLPTFDLELLWLLAICFGGLALTAVVVGWVRSLTVLSFSNALSLQMIDNIHRHMMKLPLSWFERRHVGDVVSRFNSTQSVVDFITQGAITSFVDGVMALLTLSLMFLYSPLLAIASLAMLIFYVGVRALSLRVMRSANVDLISLAARENSVMMETIRGISTIKSFGREDVRQARWQASKAASVNAQIKMGRISAKFEALTGGIAAIDRTLFVFMAIYAAINGGMTIGMIFAFQAYRQQFMDASIRMTDQVMRFKLLDVHLNRIADIAFSPPEQEGLSAQDLTKIAGRIELRGVSFRYGDGDPLILDDVSLSIEPGEMIAFVGPSGGGKTTLLKILAGLITPTEGLVLVDGIPLQTIGCRRWRSLIGCVLQDDRLFAGSLIDNITFFETEPDLERVTEACRQAAILDDLSALPLGLESFVGDMGSALSGGQRQRVMLARALYARPSVLILDEGTAHLDPDAEIAVVKSLCALDSTRLLSVHRPAAIEAAARVIMVAHGKVVPLDPSAMAKASA